VDDLDLLRLAVPRRVIAHLGNTSDVSLWEGSQEISLAAIRELWDHTRGNRKRGGLLRLAPLRWLLLGIYGHIFRWYSGSRSA